MARNTEAINRSIETTEIDATRRVRKGILAGAAVVFALCFATVSARADSFLQPQRLAERMGAAQGDGEHNFKDIFRGDLDGDFQSGPDLNLKNYDGENSAERLYEVRSSRKQWQGGTVSTEMIFRDPNRITMPGRAVAVLAAPEPASMLLLGTGLAALGGYVRKRHKR